MSRRIYLASSWRNADQPDLVARLRASDHEVYDFRNPPGRTGFGWRELDPDWMSWTAAQYIEALSSELAEAGFAADRDGMRWADTCVLLLPCGRSAHLEAGWFVGAGKPLLILTRNGQEPELMYKFAHLVTDSVAGLMAWLASPELLEGGADGWAEANRQAERADALAARVAELERANGPLKLLADLPPRGGR